jgi:hypothetical protein
MILKISKILVKTVLYLTVGVLIVLVLAFMALRLPYVQTQILNYYLPQISQLMGYQITAQGINVHFIDKVTLEKIRIKDPDGKEMIYLTELSADLNLAHLTDSTETILDHARLYKGRVSLWINEQGHMNLDRFIKRINQVTASNEPKPKKKTKSKPFRLADADLVDIVFSFNDVRSPYEKDVFDLNHFTFHEFNAHVKNFVTVADTVSLQTEELRFVEKRVGLRVNKLLTKFLISDTQMQFHNLTFGFNNSVIKNRIDMKFRDQDDFSEWNSRVRMIMNLDSSKLQAQDLGKFVAYMNNFKETYYLNGSFDGTVNNFKMPNTTLYFGKNSRLKGSFAFKGLPKVDKTNISLTLQNSVVTPEDLKQYIGEDPARKIAKFGRTTFDGTFDGTTSAFQTKGTLLSELGKTVADLKMDLKPQSSNSTYTGDLALSDFDIGKFLENEGFGKIEMSGKVQGKGFSLNDASLTLDGKIKEIALKNYTYRNIYADGTLKQGQYTGRVAIKDTNLTFDLNGEVDLRNNRDYFDLRGKISKSNLKALGITKQDIKLSTDMDVRFAGTDIDKIVGKAKFFNLFANLDRRNLVIDTLSILSEIGENNRFIKVNSDLLDGQISGRFLPSSAGADFARMVNEYVMYFSGNAQSRTDYYANRSLSTPTAYDIDFEAHLKDFDPVVYLFYPDGHISRNATIKGVFSTGNTFQFNTEGTIDTLLLDKYHFYSSVFDLTTSKFAFNPEVLAALSINSKQQKLNFLAPTEKLEAEASWDKNRIAFTTSVRQQNNSNRADLKGYLSFTEDGLSLQFEKSRFRLLEQEWNIAPENFLTLAGKELIAENLKISSTDQMLALNGRVSEDPSQPIRLRANNFRLETIAPLFDLPLKGLINGNAEVKDLYRNINIDSRLRADSLRYEDFLVGNLSGEGRWDDSLKILNLDYQINRLNNKILTLKGIYDPKNERESLDLLANLNQTELRVLQPFTKGIFSKLGGTVNGEIAIKGSVSDPRLRGQVAVKKGTIFFDYLKTTLNFDDKVYFDEEGIIAKKLKITDEDGNRATLTGGVYNGGSGEYSLGINIDMKNYKIMQTTALDNSLFYGTAYATGDLSVNGPFDALTVSARRLRSERGTQVFIPLGSASEVSEANDEEFVNLALLKKDTISIKGKKVATKTTKQSSGSSGIKLDLNFDLTPEASCEIQFNKQTGDLVKANGNGKINLSIDTKGDFLMRGDYVIDQGDYTFTFQNLLNKRFQIQRGSSISWSGDPYEATLDIKATYTRYINYLGSLIDTTGRGEFLRGKPEFNRPYPVDVQVNLKERLLTPTISFGIDFRDFPQIGDFNSAVTAFENKVRTDEQELNRQVTALLIAGQMISPNYTSFGQQNIINNLTELLSNQLSSWASQVDRNLNIDLSVNGGFDQDLIKNMQLRFSYNFNNRLRITRSGALTNANNQTNAQTLLGDLSLEWFVTSDGSVRFKTYSRNVQSSALAGSFTNFQTFLNTGFSLLYTKSFNFLFPHKKKYFPNQKITIIDDVPAGDGSE